MASEKFTIWQDVVVSGTLTGVGDVKGKIVEAEYDTICKEQFYTVRTENGTSYWSQERFISAVDKGV